MKTLEDIKAMNYQEKDELEDLVLEAIDDNDLAKVKDILKDYPVKISCYELNIKDEDGDFPLFDPFNLITRAAFTCEENNNDFSILDYLFDEYGLSLKDPKYNFVLIDMKHIKEANEKYILMKEVEGEPNIYKNALIYAYILNADNPNSQIIQYLVNRGAKFEVHNEGFSGRTPMHFWARRNNYELLELAIKGGANVDMQTRLIQESEYNETLLFEAVSEPETYKVTKLLIELGANVNFVTPTTPLDIARGSRNKKLLKDAGAMTSEQLDKKYNIYWDSKECEKDKSYMEKYCKLLNDAIKKAKENE
ncbi:ankyrin repeat domain-containing protein [Campylobacter sp. RKI_CA19_01128]|uniref:ankyrin repeat domain-containing protein n=1 Tax=unclassified Campylobacter TaxID=2593542 RepID=UPI0021E7F3BE|nr:MULTISPECIES: ankyrin repeat domain-containing protein [unclassified Campylobacter]MCV3349738.1 ankyrin repeat domain-containing protein [Campylobacter sp. RKI_CA19_01127]MCV3355765.1 ankyrin repeat domain-containing protein [Campylobacter sp. RKI_CA19_01128]HEC1777166.1 ankyrin repeat domain-containing protein [Campylobacter lari]